jgi:drug/metabolite transporter (DMT)-like permease
MPSNKVYLLATATAFFWGTNFVLASTVLTDLSPLWAAALRFLLGAGLMLAIAMRQGQDLLGLARRHAAVYLFLGLIGIAGFNLLFFQAMKTTSADNGALIMATNPLLTTLLAALLIGERASRRQLLALPVALAGVAVVVSHGSLTRLMNLQLAEGDLLMLAANLTWAAFNVGSRRLMPTTSPVGNTALMMAAGAAILTAAAVAGGGALALPGLHAVLALAIMAVAGTVLAYLFWGLAIRQLGAGRTSLFLNLVPVFAMLVGGLMGSLPTPAQIAGGLLVLAGVMTAMLPTRRPAMA